MSIGEAIIVDMCVLKVKSYQDLDTSLVTVYITLCRRSNNEMDNLKYVSSGNLIN